MKINQISRQLKEIQDGKIWIGSNFEKKLNPVTPQIAFLRPLPEIHSIAEIIAHLTIWKKEALLKIATGSGKMTDDWPENWEKNENLKKIGWKQILASYQKTNTELLNSIAQKSDDFLDQTYYDPDFKGTYTYEFVLEGMIHHDIYHLGQIGLILKLLATTN